MDNTKHENDRIAHTDGVNDQLSVQQVQMTRHTGDYLNSGGEGSFHAANHVLAVRDAHTIGCIAVEGSLEILCVVVGGHKRTGRESE